MGWNTTQRNSIKHNIITSIWLVENNEYQYKMFKCYNCGTPVFQYKGDVIQIVPGESPAKVGVVVECKNHNCQAKYKFQGVIGDVY